MGTWTRSWMSRVRISQVVILLLLAVPLVYAADDGFSTTTNGAESQDDFNHDRNAFSAPDTNDTGLGPVYNARACIDCHQNPVTGAGSQVTEMRVGRFDGTTFTDRPGGSLINDRAINSNIQEFVTDPDNVRTLRLSLSVLGDGYIEAIPDAAILAIRDAQDPAIRGKAIQIPVFEDPGRTRVGRFGWKDQHASLLSFAADAYRNEIGITNPLFPTENTSNGASVATYDKVADPEDKAIAGAAFGKDIQSFTNFMRSTQVPSAVAPTVLNGGQVFLDTGCGTCHQPSFVTADAGTVLSAGAQPYSVPAVLAGVTIYPYSDFLLHKLGIGDGIKLGDQDGVRPEDQELTRTRTRTPPLWGLRARPRLMHDGASLTLQDAILRHGGDASTAVDNFNHLSNSDRGKLLSFLASL
jgi:CxxC motif-containing protein (DUF1111 family)